MDRPNRPSLPRIAGWRRLALGVWVAGLPIISSGCGQTASVVRSWLPGGRTAQAVAAAPSSAGEEEAEPVIRQAVAGQEEEAAAIQLTAAEVVAEQPAEAIRAVPISLDAVLRLAEEQNLQIAQARAKLDEAYADQDLAGKRWLPDIYIGTSFYRHEGGIQNPNGTFVDASSGALLGGLELHGRVDLKELTYQRVSAERKTRQQHGEISKITYETLLEASSTYIDVLAAKHGVAVAREQEKHLKRLLDRAQDLAKTEPAVRVEVARIEAEIKGREQVVLRLQAQAEGASAKLIYLLGLDPCVHLLPVDQQLVPFALVDVTPQTCTLVNQALTNGPGIQALESLVTLVEDAALRAQGPARLLPTLEFRMLEGGFGAGPGSDLTWDNRWDLGLQLRWNLADFAVRWEQYRKLDAQRQQVHLAHQDLRAKLTAGVQEARETIVSGSQQIKVGKEQIALAERARELSQQRLDNNIPGSTPSEVLLSLQSLSLAQINYIAALREYDRAQLRLFLITGGRK